MGHLGCAIFVAISCVAAANCIAADLFVRHVMGEKTNLAAAITVMTACADGLIGVPFLAAFSFRERPLVSAAIAASSALCVPALFAAVFCASGIDQPVLLAVLSSVWFCVYAAMAPLASGLLSGLSWFDESDAAREESPSAPHLSTFAGSDAERGEWKVSPPILAAECCLCHENPALPATLFVCGHAFACTACFPEIIENNLQACPFCRSPRI